MHRFTLPADDRFPLAALRWLPREAARAVLQISHGMAEHAARYARFAEACAAAGFAVYAHDHRGHGSSIDASTPRGHYADQEGWSKVVGDVGTVHDHVRAAHPELPIFLFGHSMGSFIVRAFLLTHRAKLAGAILSATGWRLGQGNRALQWVAGRQARSLGPSTPSALMRKLVFGTFNVQFTPTRTGSDWLSRDPSEVDAYVADSLCGFDCSGQLWSDFFAGVSALEKAEDDRAQLQGAPPLLLIAGSRDPVSMGGFANSQLATRYKAAGNADVTDRRYPGARHELLNETNRDEVTTDLLTWMNERIAKH